MSATRQGGVIETLETGFKKLRVIFKGNVGVIALSWLLFSLTGALINPFFAKYARDLGAGDYDIALMRSLGSLALGISLVLGGLLTDYIGRVKTILIGTALVTIMQFLYAAAPDWRFLTVVYVIDSAAHFYQPALSAIIMDSLSRGMEFEGFLAINIVSSIPGLFMPIIGGFLYERIGVMGVRYGFLAQGIVALVVFIQRVKYLSETFKRSDKELSKLIFELAGYKGVLFRTLKLYVYSSLLLQLTLSVANTYMALYVIEVLGLSLPELGMLSVISTLGSILSSLVFISAGKNPNVERNLVVSTVIVSICISSYGVLMYVKQKLLLVVILSLLALAQSIAMNILGSSISTIQTRILPVEIRGRAVGIQRVFDNLGASLSAQVAGLLYTNLGYSWSFIITGFIGVLSSIYIARIISSR